MYGIVNKAIEGLVQEKFGHNTWLEIKRKSKIDDDFFINNQSYPDKITYDLATTTAEVLKISVSEVLIEFGKYWILNTGKKHYGSLLKAGGEDLKKFLINLPNFHSRIMLMYPNLKPPEFKIENIKNQSLILHYYSHRPGLKDFVIGLIYGLGEMYKTPVKVELVNSSDEGYYHEEFQINW